MCHMNYVLHGWDEHGEEGHGGGEGGHGRHGVPDAHNLTPYLSYLGRISIETCAT